MSPSWWSRSATVSIVPAAGAGAGGGVRTVLMRSARLLAKLLILYAMRLVGGGAEAGVPLLLIDLVVALAPDDAAVALEGEHVRRNAVEEPAVVRDDDGTAAEVDERVFERTQRVHVEVVGRLVEQQKVSAAAEKLRQVDAVPLAA